MRYCIVISVGYGVALSALWVALTLAWALTNINVVYFLPYGIALSLFVSMVGALLNCTFETLGGFFGASPPTSVFVGWTFVMFIYFVLTNPAPVSLEEFAAKVVGAATFVSNTIPTSDLFYELGNFTLTAVGLR